MAHTGDVDDLDDCSGAAVLRDVRDPTSLWKALVTTAGMHEVPPALGVHAFRQAHEHTATGCVDSALLLCTDWAFYRTSAKVLDGILSTGVLGDAEQDELGERLLWPAEARYEHPLGWIGTTFLDIPIGPSARASGRARTVRLDPATLVAVERHIRPPLRRWAAQRLLSRGHAAAAKVLDHARRLDPASGAAVMTGAVDAVDHLPTSQGRRVIETALCFGNKAPRKAAMEWLARSGQRDRALSLAGRDSDASIRRWGEKFAAGDGPGALFD